MLLIINRVYSCIPSMASKLDTSADQDADEYTVSFRGKAMRVDTVEDVQIIVNKIEACTSMLTLELTGNSFGVEAAGAIAQVLEDKPTLRNCLWSDMFTARLRSEIPLALNSLGDAVIKANAHLVVLDLSDNAFGPDGMKSVKHLLTSPSAFSIEELYLNNNGLGSGGTLLADMLVECHKSAKEAGRMFELKTFVCGRNRIENANAKALSEAFKVLQTLEVVKMPQNGISFPGIQALAQSFEFNPNLREIDLNDNTFTSKGAQAMTDVLPKLIKLQKINFQDCLIKENGAEILSNSFTPDHTHLEVVKLGFNEIEVDGGIALTDAISTLPSVKLFSLNGNMIGREGIEDIKVRMSAVGKGDMLDTFSDDELLVDEDSDDDDDQEKDQSKDSGETIEKEAVPKKDISPPISEKFSSEIPTQQQVEVFLRTPSREGLCAIGTNCIPTVLKCIPSTRDAEAIADLFVQITAIHSDCKDPQLESLVVEILDAILNEFSKNNSRFSSQFISYMLVHFGLLKSEDKKFKPIDNLSTHFKVLSVLIIKDYFSKSDRDMLLLFLQKPYNHLLKSPNELSLLISNLFL